jgi:hypothetical protein
MVGNENAKSYAEKVKKNVNRLPPVIGTAKSSNIELKASNKPKEFHLYIGNLDISTEAKYIEQCINEKGSGINILDVEIVKTKRFNPIRSVAAHVIIDIKDKAKAMDPENWPENITIRPWWQKRQTMDVHSKYGANWNDETW